MKKILTSAVIVISAFIFAGCGGATQNGTTASPVSGEAGQGGLKIVQMNPNGTTTELNNVNVTTETQSAPATILSDTKGMVITKDGFLPAELSLKAGNKLIIQNTDDNPHQPASDPHPAHTICPEFNAPNPLAKGETFELTVTGPKVCPIHDHLNPSLHATVTIL